MAFDVVVFGTGSLARAVCHSLAAQLTGPATALIVGRSRERAAEVAFIAGARAATRDQDLRFAAADLDLENTEALEGLVQDARICVVCASEQSPWERTTSPSGWTELMGRAGFGVSLPFQAHLAAAVARAVGARSPGTLVVNACFPDAVNPVLAALGLPIWCGVGNVAVVATALQLDLGLPDQTGLHVLAHHAQLHTPPPGCPEAMAWSDGTPVTDVSGRLATQRSVRRAELNEITGFAAGRLIDAALRGTAFATHLPGPSGLPGGYPVQVRGNDIELRLPAGLSAAEAVAWNEHAARFDGAWLSEGRIVFSPTAREALREHLPDAPDGWELDELRERLLAVRRRLRAVTARVP
ncbi:Saccharopine dehydrogenase NADP binding domain-containing protein [Amycolatopsis xylanica]|uniref:Saccharopine dehydrogenase NADP binding domain-containing protein n=1 Tax=Amycolatopsis xylanica TaxID=589385 RepID=A0A1H2U334_9PSEU|nr:saccharopine dehydrogenase NADP-binding domain-containing protein [Amycolatopsis xylanica]SDW50615.1 Saccharopine dehydrogenase NADP binding domain-containing protein [Amycolatopsis xylanica]